MVISATVQLAEQVSTLRYDDIPRDALVAAKQCLLDIVGVSIAGAHEESPSIVLRALSTTQSSDGESPVVGHHEALSLLDAVLVNGTSAHALDFDDVSGPMVGHPSAPIFPALLALAARGGVSGRELLTAFVAGFEAEVRLALALGPSHYQRGFHTTATAGSIGAAAACSRLFRLDAARTELAFGIAATQAAGLKSMFGSDTKPLHAGRAAHAGLLAALLARDGFTAATGALDATSDFMTTHSTAVQESAVAEPFASRWYVRDTLFKFHAACYLTHASIQSTLRIRDQLNQRARIRSITVTVPTGHLKVCAISDPRTPLEAKFSLAFTTALAMVTGSAHRDQFDSRTLEDPAIRELMTRVTVQPTDDLTTFQSRVAVTTEHGEIVESADIGEPPWHDAPDEQWGQLLVKFSSLTTGIMGRSRSETLRDDLLQIEDDQDLRDLAQGLRDGAVSHAV